MILLEVNDTNIPPLFLEKFSDQSPVAVFCLGFAAQQAVFVEQSPLQMVCYVAPGHQSDKVFFIGGPVDFLFFEIVHDLFGGRQLGDVDIIDAVDGSEKVSQVVLFGKAGQLAYVVQTNVDDPFDARLCKQIEKVLGCFLGKTDGK